MGTKSLIEKQHKFPVFDSIKLGWQKIKGFKATFWVAIGIYILLYLVIGLVGGVTAFLYQWLKQLPAQAINPVEIIFHVITYIFVWLANAGFFYLAIRHIAKLPMQSRMMFRTFDGVFAVKIIGTILLAGIILVIPLALLFIPTFSPNLFFLNSSTKILAALCYLIGMILFVYLLVRLSLSVLTVLDRRVNPLEAVKYSWIGTRANFWRLFGFYIINFFILLAGVIPLGIGLIWTLPYAFLAHGVAYQNRIGIVTKK
jgi:uncharacterized membrane protein